MEGNKMKVLAFQHRGNGHGKGRRKFGKRKRLSRAKGSKGGKRGKGKK